MRRAIRRILKGAGYVEGYGHHPGAVYVVAFTVFGGIAGGWPGALGLFGFTGFLFCYGAWERGR